MKRGLLLTGLIGTLLLGLAPADLFAGRKGGGKPSKQEHLMTVLPETLSSPVTPEAPLTICLGGFSAGNFVSVQVPMTGDPEFHSMVSFSIYVDSTGRFCFNSPPAWGRLLLSPGIYTIESFWRRDGRSRRRVGPTATFTITPE